MILKILQDQVSLLLLRHHKWNHQNIFVNQIILKYDQHDDAVNWLQQLFYSRFLLNTLVTQLILLLKEPLQFKISQPYIDELI